MTVEALAAPLPIQPTLNAPAKAAEDDPSPWTPTPT